MLLLSVLGPLEVSSGTARVALGGPRQRLLLGLLTAARRRVLTVDELVDGLWPDGFEAMQPRKTVQVYITRLRKAFGPDAHAISSESAGYRLDTTKITVDADAFETDLHAASTLDDDAAAQRLRAALNRWRGDAFADLRDCPSIVAAAVRLDELRISAMIELFEREVILRPRTVIGELESAVEAHPLHEGFAAQLMTAQYRAGRQADALATYRALRRRLGEQLGLEPGTAIRRLEGQILRHEISVAAATTVSATERQRRRVTVLALEIAVEQDDALEPIDPEDEVASAASVRQTARAQVLHAGGVVVVDAGGGLIACFGYPARERSVESAVRVGMAIRDLGRASDRTGGRQVRVRAGIDTGVVVVEAATGDADSHTLVGIAGHPLRSATHLRDRAAPDQVLLGPETAADVSSTIELEVTAHGMSATRVLDVAAAERSLPGLVGRDAAAEQLTTLTADHPHRLCAVVVTGLAGVGKSALVRSFVEDLDGSPSVVRVFCDRRQATTPLHPFRPLAVGSDGEPSERAIFAALAAQWSTVPVLIVEDVDAADQSTLDVLAELPHQVPSGLILMTSRSAAPLVLGGDTVPSVALQPLDRAQSRHLAASISGDQKLKIGRLNEIADRSAGVPIHVIALTRAMVAADASGITAPVPTSLYDSLMADFDRLGPARVTVQRCAVFGTAFDDADLSLLGTISSRHVATAIDSGILLDDGAGRYRFAHDLIAAAAYESMLKSERTALHETIAEGLAAATRYVTQERLAFHLEAAGRTFAAAQAWRRAGSESLRASRQWEAQQQARHALLLLDSVPGEDERDDFETRRRLLLILAAASQAMRVGGPDVSAVVDEFNRIGPGTIQPARALRIAFGDIGNRQAAGDLAGAERAARAAVRAAERIDEDSLAYARHFLGSTLFWRGDLTAALAEQRLASAFWDGPDAPTGQTMRFRTPHLTLLGLGACLQGHPAEAASWLGRADAEAANDAFSELVVAWVRSIVAQLEGRTDDVKAVIEPAWSRAIELSTEFWLRWTQVVLGWAIAGDATDLIANSGIALMEEIVDDDSTIRQAAPYHAFLLGSRLAERGQPAAGLARIDTGLTIADATGEELWTPLLHLARARCLDGMGRRADALAAADQATGSAAAMGATLVVRQCDEWRATGTV